MHVQACTRHLMSYERDRPRARPRGVLRACLVASPATQACSTSLPQNSESKLSGQGYSIAVVEEPERSLL
jgi:hypothetical protein